MKILKLCCTAFMFTFLSGNLFAQRLKGIVLDKTTYLPVSSAFASTRQSKTISTNDGKFTLQNVSPGDTLHITSIGYKPFKLVIGLLKSDTVRFYIEPASTLLSEVKIRAKRNARVDSLKNRKAYAAVFAYHATGIKDVFIAPPALIYVPDNYIKAHNSTTTILSVNLLSVIDMLSKNKAPQSKLQKVLLKDEEEEYVDRFFSPEKVATITNLKGDSLQNFMNQYHPDIKKVKKMTDYDMVVYIKNRYSDFVKQGNKQSKPPFVK